MGREAQAEAGHGEWKCACNIYCCAHVYLLHPVCLYCTLYIYCTLYLFHCTLQDLVGNTSVIATLRDWLKQWEAVHIK